MNKVVSIVVSALVALVISLASVLYTAHGWWKSEHAIELRLAQQEGRNLAMHLAFCMQASEWAEKYQYLVDTNMPEVEQSCRRVETKIYNGPVSFLTKRGETQ
jgi:hypothetical protein